MTYRVGQAVKVNIESRGDIHGRIGYIRDLVTNDPHASGHWARLQMTVETGNRHATVDGPFYAGVYLEHLRPADGWDQWCEQDQEGDQ